MNDLFLYATQDNRNIERLKVWRAKRAGRTTKVGPVYVRSRLARWFLRTSR